MRNSMQVDQEHVTGAAALLAKGSSAQAVRRDWFSAFILDRLLLWTVLLPTLLAILYFGFIASDRYISESRFIVRGSQQPVQAGLLGSLLQSTGLSRSLDDTHAVHDFILSRDALRELERKLRLADAFKKRDIDFLNRFATLSADDSFEALHKYYQRRVAVDVDSTSSIAALSVNAFTADDARNINEAILQMSERFVNELSRAARQDIVRYAAQEVKDAEQREQAAAAAVAVFRTEESVMDPERQSAAQLTQIGKVEDELIATKTQIAQLESSSPQNPQIAALKIRKGVLEREVSDELDRVTGGKGSLTTKTAGYLRVALEREFAEKQLAAAMAFLENARSEAQRQQVYLERIVQPNLPDYALEPRRLRSIVVVLVLGLMAWGVLSLLAAGIREHYE